MADQEHIRLLNKGVREWNAQRISSQFTPDFSGHSFREAFLKGVNFSGAILKGCDFGLANLRDADLSEANIEGANFTAAATQGAKIPGRNGNDIFFETTSKQPTENTPSSKKEVEKPSDRAAERLLNTFNSRLKEIQKNKILHSAFRDIPDRRYRILEVKYLNNGIHVSGKTPTSEMKFSDLLEFCEKLARECANSGGLDNIAPHLSRAVSEYIQAIEQYKETGSEVIIGLAGRHLDTLFSAVEKEVAQYAPERAGQLRSLIFSHGLLEKSLPEWLEMSDAANEEHYHRSNLNKINSEAELLVEKMFNESKIDNEIPRTILLFVSIARDPGTISRKASIAIIKAIEDIFVELFSVVMDSYKEFRKKSTKAIGVGSAIALILYLYQEAAAGIIKLSPGMQSWLERGVQWLETLGIK